MTAEDIKVGRMGESEMRNVSALVSTGTPIFQGDPDRVCIVFSAGATAPVSVWPKGFAGTATVGILLTAANPVRTVRVEDYGNLVWQPWFADDAGGLTSLTVVLTRLNKP